jgi:1-acyl-sn-glycerol-3-phosphate acyltransferase
MFEAASPTVRLTHLGFFSTKHCHPDFMSVRDVIQPHWYDLMRLIFRLVGVAVFRVRCGGRENIPASGGAMVLSNHQSHLDPPLIGLASNRRLNFLARDTLFHFAPLGWFIWSVNGIPIDREGSGLSGLKETLRRLKQGGAVVIFPEGTRSPNGQISPLKPGFSSLARRASVPLIPVGIAGAYEAWPRQNLFPRSKPVAIVFGPPLEPSVAAGYSDQELVAEIERRIRWCHQSAMDLLRAKC